MRRALRACGALVLAAGCVTVHPSSSRPTDQAISGKEGRGLVELERHFVTVATSGVEKVSNVTYFDLATCFPQKPLVTDLYSDEQLMAAVAVTRPAVLECLVDPARRGRRRETRAVVSVTASPGTGVEATVRGDNLTQEGQLCVLEAVRSSLASLPPLPEGWPPAAAQVEFVHHLDTLPAVTPGANDLSEAAGKIRLAVPSFCPCFHQWQGAPPREIEVTVNLRHPPGSDVRDQTPAPMIHPYKVYLPNLAPEAAPVAACLQEKLQAMEFRQPRLEVDIPFYFQFIDSRWDGPLPGVPAWLQHKQLEAVRNRRYAEMAVALGARSSAARAYDALVRRFEADKSVRFDALSESCLGLLRRDEAWADAVRRKLEVERLALATASELGRHGPPEIVRGQIAETERSLASAAEVRRVDEGACPRKVRRPGRPAPIQVTPYTP
ncbi:MAG TPA: hypothetical protein VND93_20550 [Myxococcales bacterium]|jgi:hypothetical protein|nr:hypothetical protein [Myxococcales bacterium]